MSYVSLKHPVYVHAQLDLFTSDELIYLFFFAGSASFHGIGPNKEALILQKSLGWLFQIVH